MLPVPRSRDVARPPAGPARLGRGALPHGRARGIVDRGGNQADGRLPRLGLCERGRKETPMRELVARFLSQSISRRSFLKGLATAGISGTAAQSILDSLIPTAHAQGAAEGIK